MSLPLKVAAFGSDRSGVSFYRVVKPVQEMARLRLIKADSLNSHYVMEPVMPKPKASPHQVRRYKRNDEKYQQLAKWCDLINSIRYIGEEQGALLHVMAWGAGKPWILDIDDDVFNLNEENPMYDVYRKRDPNEVFEGRIVHSEDELQPGEMCYVNDHGDHVAVKIKERDAFTICKQQIEDCDALTVSTKSLRDLYSKTRKAAGKDDEVYVLPNSICLRDWDACPSGPDHSPEVWVGWQGGSSHGVDLDIISNVIDALLAKHKRMRFLWVNLPHRGLMELIARHPGRVTFLEGWMPIQRYHDYYSAMNFDIALAPLADNRFNRGKSALKWMEAGARGQACVCSDVGPYREQVRDGDDGFLCKTADDWYQKIDWLISNRHLRQAMGGRARRRVEQDFNLEKNAVIREQVYREIYDRCADQASERAHLLEFKEGCVA